MVHLTDQLLLAVLTATYISPKRQVYTVAELYVHIKENTFMEFFIQK